MIASIPIGNIKKEFGENFIGLVMFRKFLTKNNIKIPNEHERDFISNLMQLRAFKNI
jgi:hypothetical protein